MYNIIEKDGQETSRATNTESTGGFTDRNQDTHKNDVQAHYSLLGEKTVFIPVEKGGKRPLLKGWPETTFEMTCERGYQDMLAMKNIGVLVGKKSGNLVDVDCDDEDFATAFSSANPDLCGRTLVSKGARGMHFWFRMIGDYPHEIIKIEKEGEHVGEFRGGNGNSVIAGQHPTGCQYKIIHEKPPLEIRFDELKWPDGYSNPGNKRSVVGSTNAGASINKGTGRGAGSNAWSMGWRNSSMGGLSEFSVGGGGYDRDFLNSLRLRLPEYLEKIGVILSPDGTRLTGLCPHHRDHNPSFAVFGDQHKMCGCYPCEFKGDVFEVSQWLGRSDCFRDAVRDVASVLGEDPKFGGATSSAGEWVMTGDSVDNAVLSDELDEAPSEAPFPIHCLPGVAGEMAKEIARVTTSQNVPLAAASVLGSLSASVGAGVEASSGGERRVRGNLYILAVTESGTGKGEAFELAAAPLGIAEKEAIMKFEREVKPKLALKMSMAQMRDKECEKVMQRADCPLQRMKAQSERLEVAAEMAGLQREIDTEPQFRVADVTKEALAKLMAGQPGQAIASMSSEARGVFSIIKGRYGKEGGDEDFYCSAYSGEYKPTNRIGRERVLLDKPCLSILWMVQPDAARDALADSALTESGLLPRFLMFDPRAEALPQDEFPAPIPSKIKENWAGLIRSLLCEYRMNGNAPRTVGIGAGVWEIMRVFENECINRRSRRGDLSDICPYAARWAENAWRLALVLHCAAHGGAAHTVEMDECTARNAVEILKWFADRQLDLLLAGRNKKSNSRLLAVLAVLAQGRGEMSFRELRRSHAIMEDEIMQLQARYPSKLRVAENKGSTGRPSKVLIVLPTA